VPGFKNKQKGQKFALFADSLSKQLAFEGTLPSSMSSSTSKLISGNRVTKGTVPGSSSSLVPGSKQAIPPQVSTATQSLLSSTVFQSKKARQTRQLVAEAAAYSIEGASGTQTADSFGGELASGGTDDYEGGKKGMSKQVKQTDQLAADRQSVRDLDRWAERETGFVDDTDDF